MVWLLVLLLGACGGDGAERQPSFAENLVWLERFGAWLEVERKLTEPADSAYEAFLADTGRKGELQSALERLEGCVERLDERVGKPAARRFLPGFDLVRRACEEFDLSVAARIRSFDQVELLSEADAHLNRGSELLAQGFGAIQRNLLANRPLPRSEKLVNGSRIDVALSRIASRLSDEPVEIRCWSPAEWKRVSAEWAGYLGMPDLSGFAAPESSRASLHPEVCRLLTKFRSDGTVPEALGERSDLADAIGVLAHEAEHLTTEGRDEQAVECFAMQRVDLFARALGADEAEVDVLALDYWRNVYPELPSEYRSFERCRDGGELDIDPGSAAWP